MACCFEVVDTHTQGEPTRVVVRGVEDVPGSTMREKKQYLAEHLDHIRQLLMFEPRGHIDMFGAIILPPTSPKAHLGVIFAEGAGYLDMCGHGTMGVVRVAIELKLVPVQEPHTTIVLDTPAGLVTTHAQVKDGKVSAITVANVPSFVRYPNVRVRLPDGRTVDAAVAYGGNFFVLVRARDVGLNIERGNVQQFRQMGELIRRAVSDAVDITHPDAPSVRHTPLVEFYEEADSVTGRPARNVVFFGAGQIDRSPCGTGTCAKMAWMYARGELRLNEDFVHESILGTRFVGRVIGETTVGSYRAVIPQVSGNAFITGYNRLVLEEDDPFPHGFLL
ncbi:MAG: proline racemase family protein [Bacillota bacterium]